MKKQIAILFCLVMGLPQAQALLIAEESIVMKTETTSKLTLESSRIFFQNERGAWQRVSDSTFRVRADYSGNGVMKIVCEGPSVGFVSVVTNAKQELSIRLSSMGTKIEQISFMNGTKRVLKVIELTDDEDECIVQNQ